MQKICKDCYVDSSFSASEVSNSITVTQWAPIVNTIMCIVKAFIIGQGVLLAIAYVHICVRSAGPLNSLAMLFGVINICCFRVVYLLQIIALGFCQEVVINGEFVFSRKL